MPLSNTVNLLGRATKVVGGTTPGVGNVNGPASATDNAIARYDGTTGKIIQNSVVTVADNSGNVVGAQDQTMTTAVGSAFTNQPANDSIEVLSSNAGDTTQTITIIGTTNGGNTVVVETVTLNGTTPVATIKSDWGIVLAVKKSATTLGTVTVREASGDLTITAGLTSAVLSVGVNTVTNTAAFNQALSAVASGATTKQLGFQGTNTSGTVIYDSKPLNGTTAVASNSSFFTLTEIYTGDVEVTLTVTVTTNGAWTLTGGAGAVLTFNTGTAGVGNSAPLLESNGSVSAPSYSFTSNTNTGFLWGGSGTISLCSNGGQTFRFANSSSDAIVYGGSVLNSLSLLNSGAISLTAAGTNQSITLTPSGTGRTNVAGNGEIRSNQTLTLSASGASDSIDFTKAGSVIGRFASTTGNLLLGGLTTDGTGLLQLATGTTSASGITLGADFNFYRYGAGQVAMDSAGNTGFALRTGGVEKLFLGVVANDAIVVAASNLFLRSGGNVAALTLDSSQNATFAGAIIGGIQALSGAGAVNVTQLTTAYTSTGGAQALTLANGSNGQIKTITHVVDGGSGVLTPTTKTGYTTITFTNAGDAVTLQYFTTQGWLIVGIFGAIAA